MSIVSYLFIPVILRITNFYSAIFVYTSHHTDNQCLLHNICLYQCQYPWPSCWVTRVTQARKLPVHSLICESCALCARLVHRHNKYYWHTNVVYYEGRPKCVLCTVSWAALTPKRSAPTACRRGPLHPMCRAYATCWMTVCWRSRRALPVMAPSAARSSKFFQVRL